MHTHQSSVIALMRSNYNNLTKTEKRITDYILLQPKEVMTQTISELSANTHSSEISVSRYCKKLGFSGLQSLKLALATDIYSPRELMSRDICESDSYTTISHKVFNAIIDGLQDTLKLLDYSAIEHAVKLLTGARQIYVFGFGNSFTICQDIETRFIRFGIPIKATCDLHTQVTIASLLGKHDLIIAVSHTGSNIDLLNSLAIAQQHKVPILAITSYMNSPLARLATVVLHGMGREIATQSEASASRLIHMAIVDILYSGVYKLNTIDNYEHLNKMRSAIAEHRL